MNKKILFILSLLSILVFLSSCGGGGGGGGLSTPPGTNTGVPSVVKLLDVQNIAQTNSTVYLKAKVLDGNGNPVQNVPVTFTNLSAPFGQLSAPIANTDATGVATVTLQSSLPGFSTVLAEINTGAGQVRERNTVFFTNLIFEFPDPPTPPPPSMTLDVDSVPGNNIFNQASDFILFEDTTDDTVEVIATVFDGDGSRVGPGESVTWASDHPEEVEFVRQDTITDGDGRAQAIIKVKPDSLRDTETHVNIGVSAGNGAVSMLTLFMKPVTVNSVVVLANPSTVDSGGTSAISAYVTTTAGTPVPDDTMVTFSTTAGRISVFDSTSDGIATTTLTAPEVTIDTNVKVTASVGGRSGSATVSVTGVPEEPEALLVIPASRTVVSGPAATTATFTISGGTAPYTTVSSNPTLVYNGTVNNGNWTTSNITATIAANAPAGTVTLAITDATGQTASATVTIIAGAAGAPTVVFTIPANNATNVPVNGDIIARFNQDLDPTTISQSTFTLFNTTDSVAYVPGCSPLVTYDSATFTATMAISDVACTNLLASKTYTATLSTGIRSTGGTPMAAPYTFSFTTAP